MTLKNQMNEFISFANILADESSKVIMEYFRQTFTIENKDDDTPVTTADKKSELKIRELINNTYPNHGILAEEFDNTKLDSEYIWVVDPIDGTRSFVAGHKDFGTLIALLYKKKPILGIINCPAHNERWIGVENQITTLNGKNIKIETKDDDTPVTIADKKSELKIRELINNAYPSHGILAEEFDDTKLNSEYIWVIDPIDGTRSFIAGHKDFGTLIALLYKKNLY